jgi:RNA recognition motif-containing protein
VSVSHAKVQRCRWAFIDFTSIEHATAALVNPKNHRLDGRSLVVEYASAEAVRRGGSRLKSKTEEGTGPRRGSSRGGRADRGGRSERGRSTRGEGRSWDSSRVGQGDAVEPAIAKDDDIAPKAQDTGRLHSGADRGGYRGVKGRSKPGAALALAKRESTAIVASQGQKITF